jgi:hypothetical protein
MRMRPARPIGLPLDVLKAQIQNPSVKRQGGKEGRKRRRTVASTPPTRVRRLTIDPLRWGSTHISGVFLHDATDFEVVPAVQRASERSSIDQRQGAEAATATATAPRNPDRVWPPTATTLKDLFAPREEGERISFGYAWLHSPRSVYPSLGFSLIGHLNLDSELELDLDLGLDESASTNNGSSPASVPTSDPITKTRPVATPGPTRQSRTNSLDTTLPFIFPQTSKGGGHARIVKVKFARTEDETQIRARWEAARGELTREWKRRHREAVKSQRRRGGSGGERVE